ncbi:hypothetical protein B0A54_12256 [Friedmanniomyces endolithicus]|uniref:Uncharacterized protein n=1 Tax=Friedmanniomyces endolithicus TaxID=329885 RepID=A0A4U0UK02_9PEZI|nr:hypothetical protein B0A54_12256 [Friedmanniomyces endolithicus]
MSGASYDVNDIEEAQVTFTKSNIKMIWTAKENLSILQLAEKAGLKPDFGCRSGALRSRASGDVEHSGRARATMETIDHMANCSMAQRVAEDVRGRAFPAVQTGMSDVAEVEAGRLERTYL